MGSLSQRQLKEKTSAAARGHESDSEERLPPRRLTADCQIFFSRRYGDACTATVQYRESDFGAPHFVSEEVYATMQAP